MAKKTAEDKKKELEEEQKKYDLFISLRPKESDPGLEKIFDYLNEKVFDNELPKIPINWVSDEFKKMYPGAMGGYCFSPRKNEIKDNYIFISTEAVDRQIEETVVHEMIHFKTQLIDYQNNVEFFSENSCCPYGKNGGHDDMFVVIGDEVHKKFGYRVDQFYTDATKTSLKNAGEENYKDDGNDYDYTFYKVNGTIRCQKIDPEAPHMDEFPIFHGRIEELNNVPPTKGNPFADKNFADEKLLNVYTRPLDKWSLEHFNFMDTGVFYETAGKLKVEQVIVMRELEDLLDEDTKPQKKTIEDELKDAFKSVKKLVDASLNPEKKKKKAKGQEEWENMSYAEQQKFIEQEGFKKGYENKLRWNELKNMWKKSKYTRTTVDTITLADSGDFDDGFRIVSEETGYGFSFQIRHKDGNLKLAIISEEYDGYDLYDFRTKDGWTLDDLNELARKWMDMTDDGHEYEPCDEPHKDRNEFTKYFRSLKKKYPYWARINIEDALDDRCD